MKPFVVIELDRERKIRYGAAQLAWLEQKLGVPLKEFGRVLASGSIRDLALLLWAGLRWEDPDLTEERVYELLDLGGLDYCAEKVEEAVLETMPVKNPEAVVAKARRTGTGTRPSASPPPQG